MGYLFFIYLFLYSLLTTKTLCDYVALCYMFSGYNLSDNISHRNNREYDSTILVLL